MRRTSIYKNPLELAASTIFCIALLWPTTGAYAMAFQSVPIGGSGTALITATGEITENTPDELLSFLESNPSGRRPTVFLDSPGGRVLASMEMGALLRKVGAEVVVGRLETDGAGGTAVISADCFSACVYALMGASKRVIPVQSHVGIHRMFAYQDELDPSGTTMVRHRRYDNGEMRGYLMRYSSDMGISPGLIVAAEHISSDNIKILSPAEIRRWHLGVSRR